MVDIGVLSSLSIFALLFLIAHSYFTRGPGITFNFFFFAFLWAMRKEGSFLAPSGDIPSALAPPFEINPLNPAILSVISIVTGWIFSFYLSWCLSERIMARVKYYRGKLFMTLLMCGLIVISISYCLEPTGEGAGWWAWRFFDISPFPFLLRDYSFTSLMAWFFCSIYFLSAFFLIECSRFRTFSGKTIFFLIPFLHVWVVQSFGSGTPEFIERLCLLLILVSLAFLSPLKFGYDLTSRDIKIQKIADSKLISQIPLAIAVFMLLVIATLDIFVLKNPSNLVSAAPFLFFTLLSVNKIPFSFIFLSATLLPLIYGQRLIPVLLPVGFIFLLKITQILSNYHMKPREQKR